MNQSISFMIEGVPVSKGRPKFARRGKFITAYTPSKTRAAGDDFISKARKFAPENPFEGSVSLKIVFVMPIPKSVKKAPVFHTKRPDLDNLLKLAEDSMNGIFYKDDSQIADIHARKVYGNRPMTVVCIEKV